ncbi:MAG TPA: hypothetical protein VFE32_21500 [Puia sp.]|jgi:hypothetical protein|nr:hypothetical protein [Puia sp.]
MKSKFGLGSFFPVIVLFFLLFGIGVFLTLEINDVVPSPDFRGYLLLTLIAFVITWLFWGEFRTKMVTIYIDGDSICVRKFGGLSKKRQYLFSEFDGFVTSGQFYGARGVLEYLYLVKGARKVIKISEAYHKNYAELKAEIRTKCKDLGTIRFSFIDELKEIFA